MRKRPDLDYTKIAKEYKDGMSAFALSIKYNCGNSTVVYILKKQGIKKRNKSEALLGNDRWKGRKHKTNTKEKIRKANLRENNPNWKCGASTENHCIRNSAKYNEWRQKVFERDGYICRITGEKSRGNIVAHHIENFGETANKRFNMENGITMLKTIHEEFHKIYGYKNNTEKQIYDFISKFGEDVNVCC